MHRIPTVKQAMTAFPYAVQIGDSIAEVQALMRRQHIRHLPVMREHEVIGVITDRDVKLILGPEFDHPDPGELTVEDVYEANVYVVDLETPLDVVLNEMVERHIGSAVVTRAGHLAGVFTGTDACRTLARILAERRGGPDRVA